MSNIKDVPMAMVLFCQFSRYIGQAYGRADNQNVWDRWVVKFAKVWGSALTPSAPRSSANKDAVCHDQISLLGRTTIARSYESNYAWYTKTRRALVCRSMAKIKRGFHLSFRGIMAHWYLCNVSIMTTTKTTENDGEALSSRNTESPTGVEPITFQIPAERSNH